MAYETEVEQQPFTDQESDGYDVSGAVDVNKNDFIDENGVYNFDKLQEVWQNHQPAMQNGYQQVQVFSKGGGEPLYFKARMSVVVDLVAQWYEVKNAMIKGEQVSDPLWIDITGAFLNCVDLREVDRIQGRPGGDYRSNDRRRSGPPQRRNNYGSNNGNGNRY